MDFNSLPEGTWRDWVRLVEPDADISDVPLSVLFKLYPEVVACGPAAVRVAETLRLAKDFLDNVMKVVNSPDSDPQFSVDETVLFPFLGEDCYDLLDDEIEFWENLNSSQGDTSWNLYDSYGYSPCESYLDDWEQLFDEDDIDTDFFDTISCMLVVYTFSEVCLALGHISVEDAARPFAEKVRGLMTAEGFGTILGMLHQANGGRVNTSGAI